MVVNQCCTLSREQLQRNAAGLIGPVKDEHGVTLSFAGLGYKRLGKVPAAHQRELGRLVLFGQRFVLLPEGADWVKRLHVLASRLPAKIDCSAKRKLL